MGFERKAIRNEIEPISGKDVSSMWRRGLQRKEFEQEANLLYEHRELLCLVFVVHHLLRGIADSVMKSPSAFLFANYGISGPNLQAYESICSLPWLLKPLLGVVSDLYPLFGYRRFSYLAVSMIVGIVGLGGLTIAPYAQAPFSVVLLCLVMKNTMIAAADLMVTVKCAERISDDPRKGPVLMAFIWGGIELGGAASSILAGRITSYFGTRIFVCTAVVPVGVLLWPVFRDGALETRKAMDEFQYVRSFHFRENGEIILLSGLIVLCSIALKVLGTVAEEPFTPFFAASCALILLPAAMLLFLRRDIALVCSFHLVQIGLSVSLSAASFFFYTDLPYQYPEGPHFSVVFHNFILAVGTACVGVVGLAVYTRFFTGWTFLDMLRMSNLIAIVLSCGDILLLKRVNVLFHFSDGIFAFTLQAASAVASNWQWIPILVLQCHLCPRGLEATTVAFFASCHNLGLIVRQFISTYLLHSLGVVPNGTAYETDRFHNLWLASLVGTILMAFTFWLLPRCIPDVQQNAEYIIEDRYSATTGSFWRKVVQGQRSLCARGGGA